MFNLKKFLKKHTTGFSRELAKQTLNLATSGLGLVAALAWNEVIKEAVNSYIQPLVGGSSGLISLFIYAILVTILAVFVTYNLSKIVKRS